MIEAVEKRNDSTTGGLIRQMVGLAGFKGPLSLRSLEFAAEDITGHRLHQETSSDGDVDIELGLDRSVTDRAAALECGRIACVR